MAAIAVLTLLVATVLGVFGMTVFWLSSRLNRIEGGEPRGEAQRLRAETEELREHVAFLQGEVERLTERVDFTEKLLDGPRERPGGSTDRSPPA